MSNGLPHLGLFSISSIGFYSGRAGRDTQMVTKGKDRILPWTLAILRRVSGSNFEHQN